MRIWLLTVGEPLPTDGPNERLLRTGILAQKLVDQGHDVTWWSSAFNHNKKTFRANDDTRIDISDSYRIILLKGCGYDQNISFQRLKDHRLVANKFRKMARMQAVPDVIQASVPTIELAFEATKYGVEKSVPVTLDARDMWPDILITQAPKFSRPLARLMLLPMTRKTHQAFRMATGITAHVGGFLDWSLKYAGRGRQQFDAVFPFGYRDNPPEESAVLAANEAWDELNVKVAHETIRVAFVGSISKQFDWVLLSEVVEKCRDLPVQFVIAGDGEFLDGLKNICKNCTNIVFAGWVDGASIWSLLRRSDIGFVHYFDTPDFRMTLSNKTIEYWSAGLPVLTTSPDSYAADLIRQHKSGIVCNPNADEIVRSLQVDKAERETLSKNAKKLFESQYRADDVYNRFVDYLERLGESR